jgi:hypothetical protein
VVDADPAKPCSAGGATTPASGTKTPSGKLANPCRMMVCADACAKITYAEDFLNQKVGGFKF